MAGPYDEVQGIGRSRSPEQRMGLGMWIFSITWSGTPLETDGNGRRKTGQGAWAVNY